MAGLFTATGAAGGFQRLPEGKHILQVRAVEFDPEFFTETTQIVEVVLATKNGITHKEKFNVAIEGGAKAFTYLVKVVHDRFDIKEGESIDELVDTMTGLFLEATVKHENAVNRKTGELIKTKSGDQVINVRLDEKKHSEGWETDDRAQAGEAKEVTLDEPAGFEF